VVEFDLETQEANVLAAFQHDQAEVRWGEILPADIFNTRVLKQGRIYVVHDIRALVYPSSLEQTILEQGIYSYINVPLHVRGELIGSLNIGSDQPNSFTGEHLDIVEEVAISLAIAIQQARLYEQARQDAETKAMLLHEVNHRVKNNLAAIVGLLYIEQQHTGMEKQATFQAIMKDLINRIEGLATVHQMLSASAWAPLSLSDLVTQIIRSVLQAFPSEHRVSTFVTSPEAVWITPEQASSLAMVINEMATNTVKYALPVRTSVSIFVDITVVAEMIILEYRDNGPGFPEAVLRQEYRNVGIYLIFNIVQRDLQGEVTLTNDNGAVVTICFKAMDERKKKWS
jgi:ribose transport system ATP-binding protein